MQLNRLNFSAESCKKGRLDELKEIPTMRMTIAATAFEMPIYGIIFPLFAFQTSSAIFRGTKKMSCAANYLNKFLFVAQPILPVVILTRIQTSKVQHSCVLDKFIKQVSRLRSPIIGWRSYFFVKNHNSNCKNLRKTGREFISEEIFSK